jgi:hypothetical protein
MSELPETGPKRTIKLAYIVTAVAVSALMVGASLGIVMTATTPSTPTVIQPGSNVIPTNFVIFSDGAAYYAKNGTTGEVSYSNTNCTALFQQILSTHANHISLKNGIYTLQLTGNTHGNYSLELTDGILIDGENPYTTVLKTSNGANAKILSAHDVTGITLRDLGFDGNWATQSDAAAGQIDLKDCRNILIDNCRFSNYYGTAVAFGVTNSQKYPSENVISNSIFEDLGKVIPGAGVYTQQNNVHVQDCYFANLSDNAVVFEGASNGYLQNNIGINMAALTFVNGLPGLHSENILISGNYVRDTNRFIFELGGDISVDNLTISDNIFQNTISGTGIEIRGGVGVRITDNTISNVIGCGIILMSNYTSITGNLIYNCTANGLEIHNGQHITIMGNNIHDNGEDGAAYCGVFLDYSTNVTMSSNQITNNYSDYQDYGIYEDVGSDYNIITNNIFSGNRVHQVVKTGTHTSIHYNIGYVTENRGFATGTGSTNSASVNHGLSATPTIVIVTANNTAMTGNFFVTSIDSTQFVIFWLNPQPYSNVWGFYWYAEV